MNEKFFSLPEEKQQRILNAGFYVFSQNSYKKSPMSEIADRAEISKSLLFFYFRNKKELYLFLWESACRLTIDTLTAYRCYEPANLFEMMERGMHAKFHLMELYPYVSAFCIKAFYERDPQVCSEIQESFRRAFQQKAAGALAKLDPKDFVPGLDLGLMYREMYWASEGYLWEMMQRGPLDRKQMEQDFARLLEFWKSIYYSEEKKHECH